MATVFLADDETHHRRVALKLLAPEWSSSIGSERFLREIRIAASLTHPHILPVLDSGLIDGKPFYSMPFVAGHSLRDRITSEGALPVETAVKITMDIADALAYAHSQGFVHRDIKPENILLNGDEALVADFGIARILSDGDGNPTGNTLTGTGIAIGTPAYMSPEQGAAEGKVDQRSDLYSLGCVLYEMLAGIPPFSGPNAQAVLARHMVDSPPPLSSVRPGLPPSLERVVSRALAKSPADRFQSSGELKSLLAGDAAAYSHRPSGALPGSADAPRSSRARAVIGVVLATAVIIGAFSAARWRAMHPSDQKVAVSKTPKLSKMRIAVLPMANLSASASDAYFAAGMTDELISRLGSIGAIRVIARSTVIRYAGSNKPIAEIASELGVGSVLESTVRKTGNRVRIGVHLIDAASQEELWASQYDRDIRDVFAIQEDVAKQITSALAVRMADGDSREIDKRPTNDVAAYEDYLRGNLIEDDSGIALLERAVRRDPGFAEAHAALGMKYILKMYISRPGPVLLAKATREVQIALNLNPTLAEGYLGLAALANNREAGWREEDALRYMLKAIKLKPNLSRAHAQLSLLLWHNGVFDQAQREIAIKQELDPATVSGRAQRILWYEGLYDSALAVTRRLPTPPADEEAVILSYLGRTGEGMAKIDSVLKAGGDKELGTDGEGARALLLAKLGRNAEAEAQIAKTIRIGQSFSHFHHAEFFIACAYAVMGKKDLAVEWLRRTADDGLRAYPLFITDPNLQSLRGYPPYQRFLADERVPWERFRKLAETTP